jgi:D-sedoheptulose 7-phosphate isomerase
MQEIIKDYLKTSIQTKEALLENSVDTIVEIATAVQTSLKQGGFLYAMGNGGSASDAQHLVAELLGRFRTERGALPAIALTPNSSTITAIANDYGYDEVFARQLSGLCRKGDVVIGISTSGRSESIIKAMKIAKKKGTLTIALTGFPGEPLASFCDHAIVVPSKETSFVQEAHICVIHMICHLLDLFYE